MEDTEGRLSGSLSGDWMTVWVCQLYFIVQGLTMDRNGLLLAVKSDKDHSYKRWLFIYYYLFTIYHQVVNKCAQQCFQKWWNFGLQNWVSIILGHPKPMKVSQFCIFFYTVRDFRNLCHMVGFPICVRDLPENDTKVQHFNANFDH